MKKNRMRNQRNEDGRKKIVLKFREFDDDFEDFPHNMRRRKNNGKRKHRQQTLKGMFYANEINDNLMF